MLIEYYPTSNVKTSYLVDYFFFDHLIYKNTLYFALTDENGNHLKPLILHRNHFITFYDVTCFKLVVSRLYQNSFTRMILL